MISARNVAVLAAAMAAALSCPAAGPSRAATPGSRSLHAASSPAVSAGVHPGVQNPPISAEEAREDIRYLEGLLERVHPDPYTAFGGRIGFKRRVLRLLEAVPPEGLPAPDLGGILAEWLGELGDGHTFVGRPAGDARAARDLYLPLELAADAGGVHVAAAREDHSSLQGARVLRAQGDGVDRLCDRIQTVFPRENIAGRRALLARLLSSRRLLSRLMPATGDGLTLRVRRVDGEESEITVAYALTREEWEKAGWRAGPGGPAPSGAGLFRGVLLEEERVAYFRFRSVWSREALEIMRASGRTDTEEWLERIYRRHLRRERPADLDQAIAEVPSLIHETRSLLGRMEAAGVPRLIVDLRGNDGGWTRITEPFLFLLFGDRYLAAGSPVSYVTVLSQEKLRIDGKTLDQVREAGGEDLEIGDYLFRPGEGGMSREAFVKGLADDGVSDAGILATHRAPESLEIVVITDGNTFSAAFDLTYDLWRFGARLLGVPPAQSPTAFVDGTPFRLPRSGLEGAVSRTAVIHPEIPRSEGAIVLDFPMGWSTFREFGFRPDAPVEYAVRVLKAGA